MHARSGNEDLARSEACGVGSEACRALHVFSRFSPIEAYNDARTLSNISCLQIRLCLLEKGIRKKEM